MQFRYDADVCDVTPAAASPGIERQSSLDTDASSSGWEIHLADGSTVNCSNVVMATGGMSFPKVGTDGTGYNIMRKVCFTQACMFVARVLCPPRGGQSVHQWRMLAHAAIAKAMGDYDARRSQCTCKAFPETDFAAWR